jgi:CheY-like chemotaxis protein
MYFPEVSGPVEWSEILPGKRQSGAPSGSRILLVEDEPGVRDAVRRQLEHLGYEVLTANNGDEGLRLLKSGGDVNLLLTDAVLPGVIQGHQLAEIAEAEFPDMKVIMVSGYAHDSRDDAEKSGKTSYPRLMKPVSIADLEKAITATLKPD